MGKLRYWLIRMLIGKATVLANAQLSQGSGVTPRFGGPMVIFDNDLSALVLDYEEE